MLHQAARVRPTLADEVAIVTGASSTIGAATARELGRRGATVVLAARRMGDVEGHLHAIRTAGGEAMAIPTDVADSDELALLVERTMAAFGRVDVLVNNSGAGWLAALASSSADEIVQLVEVNLLCPMLLTRAVLPGMLERHHGAIITVVSVSGRAAMEPLYSATKSGVRGFSLSLRRQIIGSGVSVSLLYPGKAASTTRHVRTRLPGPELVATTIADLVREPHREVELPRSRRALARLERVFPALAERTCRPRRSARSQEEEGATWTF